MTIARLTLRFALIVTALVLAACQSAPQRAERVVPQPVDSINLARARSLKTSKPIAVLVIETDRSAADRMAQDTFQSLQKQNHVFIPVIIDLKVSSNRAIAAPLHAADTPTLIGLSPNGIILGRDVGNLTAEQMTASIKTAPFLAAALDEQFAQLSALNTAHPDNTEAAMRLADFLLAHQNDKEAIAVLRTVADHPCAPLTLRVKASVAMAKAQLWIGEPEKARHGTQAMIATLGPQTPEAIAGGNLVLGIQDTNAKRFPLARQEFEAAIGAAPNSTYAAEAKAAVAQLPGPVN